MIRLHINDMEEENLVFCSGLWWFSCCLGCEECS